MNYRVKKRIFDLLSALFLLPFALTVMLPIAILIKLDSRGAVLHRQKRVGLEGREFVCYKFRTMRVDAPVVARAELKNAQKYVTRVGKFLRKHSLDELPQIFNVIKGDMSLVGPRPLLVCEEAVHRMRADCGIYTLRPGITGLCQIREREVSSAYRRVAIDYEYFCKKSIKFDVCILFWTVFPRKVGNFPITR